MVSYKELGLVNTRDMFARAIKGGYAIPAFNFNNMEQMQAIIQASVETKSPVILQVSKGARNYANQTLLRYMAEGAVQYAKELGCEHPEIVLHLDHGDSFELCKSCVDLGFSSVMIDGSHLPYDENVELTRRVVEYAHKYDVTVEGELGVLAGVEFQKKYEHLAYEAGNGKIPVQLFADYKANRVSTEFGSVKPNIRGGYQFANLNKCLPAYINDAIIEGILDYDRKLKGFSSGDAVLSGIESRTSSPVRIVRDETYRSDYAGLFPCGEGAGYAGGITSAAVDGIKVAEAVAAYINNIV